MTIASISPEVPKGPGAEIGQIARDELCCAPAPQCYAAKHGPRHKHSIGNSCMLYSVTSAGQVPLVLRYPFSSGVQTEYPLRHFSAL